LYGVGHWQLACLKATCPGTCLKDSLNSQEIRE
jgi:hypothetical protein